MSKVFGFYVTALVCALASTGLATEIALVPVSANQPHVIAGNEITVPAGSTVIFEIRVSDWDPNLTGTPQLRAYQMELDELTYSSGTQGTLRPARVACTSSADCIGPFGGACSFAGNPCFADSDCEFPEFGEVCVGPTCSFFTDGGRFCTPGFTATKRADWVFKGLSAIGAEDLSSPGIRFGYTLNTNPETGPFATDPGFVTYGGTLVLEIPADATGTFTVGFTPSPATFLFDSDNTRIDPTTLTPVRIVIGDVGCTIDFDCDDNSLCTDDTCVDSICSFTPNFDDTIACCNPGTGGLCGKSRAIPGDATFDGVIDLTDFLLMQTCFGDGSFPADCVRSDVDCDCGIDLDDIAAFSKIIDGP